MPLQWAITQENMALVFLALAALVEDPAPALKTALSHVEAALTMYHPEHSPYYHEKASRLRDDILARLDIL